MKKLLGILAVLLITFSCGDGFDREAEVDKILDLHDEVMPKIGEVMNLRKKVLAKATDLESGDGTNEQINALRDLAQDLDNAQKGMMQWMNDWAKKSNPHVKGTSTLEEQKAFFADEVVRVTKVKDDINNSIAEAKEALK